MQNPNGAALKKAKILQPTPENIETVAHAIRQGKVVGMPTETVYGLAGDSRSPAALARIFDTKERPTFDPLIIHVGPSARGIEELERLRLVDGSKITPELRKRADLLIQSFWPGPLTLVLPKHADVPDLATSGLPTVAIRMPRHPVAQALIAAAQTPLAAPSANRFGRISPTTAQAVAEELGDRIDFILEGGASEIGLESTVIALTETGEIRILRPGGTPQEEIERVLGLTLPPSSPSTSSPGKATPAPGMLESHYAPEKPLRQLPTSVSDLTSQDLSGLRPFLDKLPAQAPIGLLLLAGDPEVLSIQFSQLIGHPVVARTLSLKGNLSEAARNLFAEMRWLDASPATLIFAEPTPSNQGLGHAISDRLRRASTRQ